MMTVTLPREVVRTTLSALQSAGRNRCECVVLWLGQRNGAAMQVLDVYVPRQHATGDSFTIPRASIAALLDMVGHTGLTVVAQVHSHPMEAFHSLADDSWAVVRHAGALSLVLPRFALESDVESFWADAAIYCLSAANEWCYLPNRELRVRNWEAP